MKRTLSLLIFAALLAGCRQMLSHEEWGTANKMLRIRIAINTETNQRHNVTLFFQNAGNQPLKFFESQFWLNTKILCYNGANGTSAEPTPEGKELFSWFSPGGYRAKNALIPLSPGEVHEGDTIELERVYQLTNGVDYQVKEIYQEGFPELPQGWSGAVTSNIVNLRLNPKN